MSDLPAIDFQAVAQRLVEDSSRDIAALKFQLLQWEDLANKLRDERDEARESLSALQTASAGPDTAIIP